MTDFTPTLRHYCRYPKCRSRLPAPVQNPREAFCTKGCYSSFYRHRCLICEGAMERKTERQLVCGKRRCRNALQSADNLGRYHAPSCRIHPLKTSIKPGIKNGDTSDRASLFANAPLNILGGGSWRWPNTAKLDVDTLENIRHREIAAAPELPYIADSDVQLVPHEHLTNTSSAAVL